MAEPHCMGASTFKTQAAFQQSSPFTSARSGDQVKGNKIP
jgi:hypothetical protein